MAIKKTIEIDVNTTDAIKDVDKLTDSVKDLEKQTEEVGAKSFKGVGSNAKKAGKGVKGLSANFKALGGAIKATGIGLLVTVLASLAEGLSQNERASKFFKTAVEAVSIVTQDFINFVIDNGGKVVKLFKNIFEDPQKAFKEFAKAFKENIQERFDSYLDTLGFLASAVKKVFSGDFAGALEDVKSAGKESIDVLTGVNNSFDKGVEIVNDVTNAVAEYGKEIVKSAERNVDLARSAEIAAAKTALLKEEFEIQAEKLRQIRDNDLISIDERIKANDKLAEVLKKQQEAQLKEADLIIASAQAQFNKSKTTENEVALIQALGEKKAILNNIETQNSEQLVNKNALIKEGNELVQSGIDADTQRALNKKQFEASLLETERERLEKQRENLEEEKTIEKERLQAKIDSFALGTQARVDAEIELKDKLQEIGQRITTNEKAQDKEREKSEQAVADTKKKLATTTLNFLGSVAKEGSDLAKGVAVAQATINTFQGITSELATKTTTPFEFGLKLANIASVTAIGFKSVQDILSTNATGKGGAPSASGGGGSAPAPPPAFNLVGGSDVNQVEDSIGGEQPLKAFVVGSEVTNQQEIDNAQAESASLG